MDKAAQIEQPVQRSRCVTFLVIGLALLVLGVTLAWSAFDLRSRIRSQIVQRDGETLDAVAVMQHLNDQANGETIASLSDPGEQFQLALKISRLHNVLGVRLYSSDGHFANAFPAYITEKPLPAMDLAELQKLQPVSRFVAHGRMQEEDLLADTNAATAALQFVEVPLRGDDQRQLVGIIQFLMDGRSIARQYAELDRNLALKFSVMFAMGAGILIVGLGLALRRVQSVNRKLAERTQNLLQANRELALAARTSAVGAVASHLIHGLKNPLTGLRLFVSAHNAENGANGSRIEWRTALSTTQRMEELINRVVRVLQEQQSGTEYQLSIPELAALLTQRAKAAAEAAGVHFETKILSDQQMVSNREADLILLILENLTQNAIEATPPGNRVEIAIGADTDTISFDVRDQGPGLASGMESRLFMPCASQKKGGGGIGLAISKQLAHTLGAKLELAQSSPAGCTFRLVIPQRPEEPKPYKSDKQVTASRPI